MVLYSHITLRYIKSMVVVKTKNTNLHMRSINVEDCIAKTELHGSIVVPGMTVEEHGLLTAYVYSTLTTKLGFKKLFPFISDTTIAASLHDIGKISLPFQQKIWSNVDSTYDKPIECKTIICNVSHSELSGKTIAEYSNNKGFQYVVWNHHGIMLNNYPASSSKADFFGGIPYYDSRIGLIKRFEDRYGKFPNNLSIEQIRLISGCVTVSDWISSSVSKHQFLENCKLAAQKSVKNSGISKIATKRKLVFKEIFGFSPNEMQKTFIESVDKPGIHILEAQMGMGKTEAAIYAAYKLILSGHANGLYFALPTQLTSVMTYNRVKQAVSKFAVIPDSSVRLVFSSSDLYAVCGDELDAGGSWFDSKKRSILAPVGVGTIDQALMAVINVKHSDVRLFGLANKVVILDEVHSYDMYTSTILEHLVSTLRKLGCTVFILSATLNENRRKALLSLEADIKLSQTYPLVSCQKYGQKDIIIEKSIPTEEEKVIHYSIESDENILYDAAVNAALDGEYVLWIENTVDNAQGVYRILSARLAGTGVEVGLIHSRFTRHDRAVREAYWTGVFGKDNTNRYSDGGKVLIGTQVLEQSLDIDSDLLITRICPIDMLLQRMGRLRRHEKFNNVRKTDTARCFIGSPKYENVSEPVDEFGVDGLIYSPYFLMKSLCVLSESNTIKIPADIRKIIDSVYCSDNPNPRLEKARAILAASYSKLSSLARLSLNTTLSASSDDGFTRYSEFETIDVLLLKEWNYPESITTLDGSILNLSSGERKTLARTILSNTVPVQKRKIGLKGLSDDVSSRLKPFVYVPDNQDERIRVCVVKDSSMYDISGNKQERLRYSERLGFEIIRSF